MDAFCRAARSWGCTTAVEGSAKRGHPRLASSIVRHCVVILAVKARRHGTREREMSDTASIEGQVALAGGSTSEFLVQMEVQLPADFPPDERAELLRAEAVRARELAAAGILVRLWRVVGRRANVGIWHATTTAALHEALESLPLFPLPGHPRCPARPAP